MKRNIFILLIVASILIVFSTLIFASETIDVKDYIKDKFPSIFNFYLSSLEDLDSYEKEFIDLLQKLPKGEQEYYAKEVYKNGFSLELLKSIKEGKTIQTPTSTPPLAKPKEKPIESLPSIIKRIEPSIVSVFTYDKKGEFLKLGSGFFISQSGDIITNYHVLQGASSAEIKASDGKTHPINYIVADDEQSDIICLSVNIPSQYVYPLSLSTTIPEVGERIIVYGSPLGLEKTASDGIISAIREVPGYGKLIQISAPISPGSSGSPVLNMKGEVIGIATLQMVEGQNLNFAIPSERIARLNLMEEEKTFTTEELFEQEDKEKKDSDYAYEALDKALYFTFVKEEYEKALPYWEIVIEIEPAAAYFAIGYCYEKLGAYTKAVEAYKQAIRLNPVGAIGHCRLGRAYYGLGLYKDAIESYKQAIRIDPDYTEAYSRLGQVYFMFGRYKDAIEQCKQAIRIDPDYAEAYNLLGGVYGALGRYKDAIEVYKQAIRIDPDNVDAHFGLGLIYLSTGDRNLALNEYKILKELDIDKANKLFDFIY